MEISRLSKTASGVLLVIALGSLAACDQLRNYNEQELLQRAKSFQNKGDLKASVIELKNALQKNPNNAEARWLLGEIYIKTGQGSEAEKELLKARQIGVSEEAIKPYLGQALLMQGLYKRVLDEITQSATSSIKNIAKIKELRGRAELGLGHFQEGCELFAQAQDADAGYVPSYRGAARCAASHNDFEGAKSQLLAALKQDSGDAETWVLLGDLERIRNNPQAAETAYLSAKKIDKKNVGAYLGMASMYVAAGNLDKASGQISEAREAWPNNVLVRYAQAFVLYKQGKYHEARDQLQQVIKLMPDHMPSILLSGQVAFSLGAYEKAEADINKFLSQYPGSMAARKWLVLTLLKTGQAEKAIKSLVPVLSEQTQDPVLYSLAAEAYMALSEYDKATAYLEKASAVDPKNIGLRTGLGISRLAKGDEEQAVAELEAISSLDPKQHKADVVLALNYIGKKEFDKALQTIEVLEKKQPNNPVTFNLKGGAYLGKNDVVNARKSFEHALTLAPAYVEVATTLAQLDLKDNRPDAARKRFEGVLAKDKNNETAMLALAALANTQGQEAEFVNWLERAAKANPRALQPRVLMARYFAQKNEPQKALAIAREAQNANPNSPEALDMLGSMQLAAGEKDNAVATYNKLVELAPRSPLAFFRLASALATAKKIDAAKEALNKSLELKPNYLEAQVAMVMLETQAGNYAEAVKVAQNLQRQYPDQVTGYALEGDALSAQKKYQDAAKIFGKALIISKNGIYAIKIHQAQSLGGNAKGADDGLLQWLREHSNDNQSRWYLAQVYTKNSKRKQAIEQYEFILQSDPANIQVLNNLSLLYQQEKDARAISTAERAYKLKPGVATVADTLGWILVEQGQIVRGLEVLKKAVAADPNNMEIGYHYAFALAKSGNKGQARKQLEGLLSSDKSFPQKEQAKALLKQL